MGRRLDTEDCILTLSAAGYPEWIHIPAVRWMVAPCTCSGSQLSRRLSQQSCRRSLTRLSWQWNHGCSLAVLRAQTRANLKPLGQWPRGAGPFHRLINAGWLPELGKPTPTCHSRRQSSWPGSHTKEGHRCIYLLGCAISALRRQLQGPSVSLLCGQR